MAKNELKWGAIFSYILILLNATYGLFLTPYILGQIGEISYGVYRTISAFTSSLMVLDLGLGATMMRYIAKYRSDKEDHKIPNFLSMGLIQTSVICLVVGIVTSILYNFLDDIYANGLTTSEIVEAKKLYIFLAIGIIAHVVENFLNGIISGYNRFTFANGIKVIRLLARIFAVVVFLQIYRSAMTLVIIDLLITVLFVFIELMYMFAYLKVKVKDTHWDKQVFCESFVYTLLMFFTSIVAQANSNFSNIVIGAVLSASAVTVYSMAVLIFNMFEQMSTAISGVMLPTVTNTLKNDDDKYTQTTKLAEQVGRIQFVLLGAVVAGFSTLGKYFIQIWLGDGYEDVYLLVLILICPALFELCINVCLSILRAKNIIGFRTAVITVSTAANLAITLLFTRSIGYFAAAIGTAISFLFGSVIVMCIYYRKKLGINMVKLYAKIFKGIWLSVIISAIACWATTLIVDGVFLKFTFGFVSFVVVYAITLMVFGLNEKEKKMVINILNKVKNKEKKI